MAGSLSPDDDRRLTGQYRPPLLYGPFALFAVGVAMIVYAMVVHRSDAVLVTFIVLGVVCLVAGLVLARTKGPIEVGTRALKTSVLGLRDIDPEAFAVTAKATGTGQMTDDWASQIRIGDIWEQARRLGWREDRAMGHVLLTGPSGQSIELPVHDPYRPASKELRTAAEGVGLLPPSQPYATDVGD